MCIYLLTCLPICIHSMLLGLFCSLILVKNWLKKFSIAEKKSFNFGYTAYIFNVLFSETFICPDWMRFSSKFRNAGYFLDLLDTRFSRIWKHLGKLFLPDHSEWSKWGKKIKILVFYYLFPGGFFKLEEKITKRVFSNLDFDALSSNTYVYTFKYVSTYSLICFHVQIFYLVQYIFNLLFSNQNHQKIYIMQTFLHIWNYGKMVLYLQTYFIFLYTYTIYPISVRSNLEPIEPRFIKKGTLNLPKIRPNLKQYFLKKWHFLLDPRNNLLAFMSFQHTISQKENFNA